MNAEDLIRRALEAGRYAHAPYSDYQVGAAVLGSDGRVWIGCNIENASFGLTICAERVAVFKMVADGILSIDTVAVVTKDGGTPCGACLQVLNEFAPDPSSVKIIVADHTLKHRVFTLNQLLPYGFKSGSLD
ncbi:MAG TPA: cytidine deaminase [Fimbriimonadaceae bacterium]|nr:cytidine deaminase [Fimbriimonadaceae bacterium]